MSAFDTGFSTAALPVVFGTLSQSVTYYPNGGDSKTISAIVGHEHTSREDDGQGRIVTRRRRFTVTTDPDDAVYGGVASPNRKDTIQFSGERWAVNAEDPRAIVETGNYASLMCVIVHRAEVGPPNLRKKTR